MTMVSRILPGVRSISGHAMVLLLELADQVARWRDALPNDPETFREAARQAQTALERAADMPNAAAGKSTAFAKLSLAELTEMHRARNAWFLAGTRAVNNAWKQFGPDWRLVPGHRVTVHVARRLRVFVSKTGKVSLDQQMQIVPAPFFWDTEMPEGVTVLHDTPCVYRPDLKRLLADGKAWSSGELKKRGEIQRAEAAAAADAASKAAFTDAFGNRAA